MAKAELPEGATRIVRTGASCEKHGEVVVAVTDDGDVVGMTQMKRCQDGQPLPRDADLFHVDETGKILDSMRLGNGPRAVSAGPAQVATEDYREGWSPTWDRSASTTSRCSGRPSSRATATSGWPLARGRRDGGASDHRPLGHRAGDARPADR